MAGIGGIKKEISPVLLFAMALALGLGRWQTVTAYIISVSLHELTHFFTAEKLGYRCTELKIGLTGAVLYGDFEALPPKDEVAIALSAPLMNIGAGLVFTALWWMIPESYIYTDILTNVNYAFGLINLLPFYPLDGGRAAVALLSERLGHKKSLKVTAAAGGIVGAAGGVAFFIGALTGKLNITLGVFALYASVSAVGIKKESVYTRLMFSDVAGWRLNRGTSVYFVAMNGKKSIFDAHKKCRSNKLCIIKVYSDRFPYEPLGEVSVMQLEEALISLPSDTQLKDLLKEKSKFTGKI